MEKSHRFDDILKKNPENALMKITINTFGSRGDVQPFIALGKGLVVSGHEVKMVTHRIFESFVRDHNLDFIPLDIEIGRTNSDFTEIVSLNSNLLNAEIVTSGAYYLQSELREE